MGGGKSMEGKARVVLKTGGSATVVVAKIWRRLGAVDKGIRYNYKNLLQVYSHLPASSAR